MNLRPCQTRYYFIGRDDKSLILMTWRLLKLGTPEPLLTQIFVRGVQHIKRRICWYLGECMLLGHHKGNLIKEGILFMVRYCITCPDKKSAAFHFTFIFRYIYHKCVRSNGTRIVEAILPYFSQLSVDDRTLQMK